MAPADRHRDRARPHLLAGRGVPPAVLREDRTHLLPDLLGRRGDRELDGRTYQLHVPAPPPEAGRTRPAGSGPRLVPLILAFHGGGATGTAMRRLANLDARADGRGWAVAYPDGIDGHWNDGRGAPAIAAHRDRVDDVGFAVALVDHLVATAGVDPSRVYATGMSNGAMLCHRLAAERPDVVAAIAPVAGTLPEPMLASRPVAPVPVLMVHGTDDPIVFYGGGPVQGPGDRGRVASVRATAAWWRGAGDVAAGGTGPPPAVEDLGVERPDDPTRVRAETWAAEPGRADVVVVTVEGGGHTWPGGLQYLPVRVIGRTTAQVHASDLVARFFAGRTPSAIGG